MNKQEFLEEVGRLAERLFPEPVPQPNFQSREWWALQLTKECLSPRTSAPREVIEAWVRGDDVWHGVINLKHADGATFTGLAGDYSLTDPSLPKPRKYRPWTWADRGLVPDELVRSVDMRTMGVTGISVVGVSVAPGGPVSWAALRENFTQPDGSPCGVEVSE